MKRSTFLKGLGLAGFGTLVPLSTARAAARELNRRSLPSGVDCVLIPQETRGPYPLNLSSDSTKFRQDITEGRPGLPLELALTIVNVNDNCRPLQNVRVDVWHCDKDGVYSGFQQPGSNTVGQTFMRGIQMTDSNGVVQFHTIYPGWYQGRVTHIHFEMYLNSVLSATSQLAFPDEINTAVYNTPLYSAHGQNSSVARNTADMVFSSPASALQYQIANVTPNETTGGYNASLTVGINAPVSGIIELEPETGGQFKLLQNYPNPFRNRTTFAFSLAAASRAELTIFDTSGREVVQLFDRTFSSGDHAVDWQGTIPGNSIAAGPYVFQLTVENSQGIFRQSKVLTVQ